MFENIAKFFKKFSKEAKVDSKDTAKERLHLVLMQDRANVSTDFLEMMKQEIIEVIKKYIDVDENSIDVKLTNKTNTDGTTGAPMLYANIPITNLKNDTKRIVNNDNSDEKSIEQNKDDNSASSEEEKIKEDTEIIEEGKKETEVVNETIEEVEENKENDEKEDVEETVEENETTSENDSEEEAI